MRKMKILQITSYPPPQGGIGIRAYYLKKEIEKNGDICEVLNIGKSRFMKGRDFIPVFSGLDYVKKVLLYRLKGYKIQIRLIGDSPKGFILTILAELISLLTFKRPIVVFHAGPIQVYFPKFKAPHLSPMFKFIFGSAKYIICNSEKVKKSIMTYNIPEEKIFPIPSFSTQYLNFKQVKINGTLNRIITNNFPVIFSYMFYRPHYFLEDIMYAFFEIKKKYPNAYLIFAGSAEPEDKKLTIYAKKIKKLIQKLDISHSIYYLGDINHNYFLTVLSKVTLFLRTPVKDGISSSVLESLVLKTPVVACENGSRPEGVVTYKHRDIKDMVDKISFVIENYAQVKKGIKKPFIENTIAKEIDLLKGV